MEFVRKIVSAREASFSRIACKEATPRGYKRYAPITRGPIVACCGILLLGLVVPFYVAWRVLMASLAQRRSS